MNPLDHTYHANGKEFPVLESDRVTVKEGRKIFVTGFNHTRAWTAANEEARS